MPLHRFPCFLSFHVRIRIPSGVLFFTFAWIYYDYQIELDYFSASFFHSLYTSDLIYSWGRGLYMSPHECVETGFSDMIFKLSFKYFDGSASCGSLDDDSSREKGLRLF